MVLDIGGGAGERLGGGGAGEWREKQNLILYLFIRVDFKFTISAFRFSSDSFDVPSALQGALIINHCQAISRCKQTCDIYSHCNKAAKDFAGNEQYLNSIRIN